jgi:hypothetical protein
MRRGWRTSAAGSASLNSPCSATERIVELTSGHDSTDIDGDRDRRDAVLWNFTVLGEAVAQVSDATKSSHPGVTGALRSGCATASFMGIGRSMSTCSQRTAHDDLPAFLAAVRAIELPR